VRFRSASAAFGFTLLLVGPGERTVQPPTPVEVIPSQERQPTVSVAPTVIAISGATVIGSGSAPEAALATATINAARMMGRDQDYGSIAAGKAADLLIVDADPLADIGNVRRIHRVIKGGTVHDPAQLLSGFRITGPGGAPRN